MVCRYTEVNFVRVAWQYPWSSAAEHVRGTDPTGLLDLSGWADAWSGESWKTALREREDDTEVAALRLSTHRGRPLATDAFLAKLERRLGRRLRPLPVGRPRKPRPPVKAKSRRKKARTR
jgi:putative transposase